MRGLLIALLLMVPLAAAAASGDQKLDRANIDTRDAISIQRGAQVFVNYCLNCHSAEYMRYNRLTDLGITEQQIKDNLMFMGDKVGDTMQVAMRADDTKQWFGVAPPDLSVISRSRGADWLYTYLRTFYRDGSTTTGWNNLAFPNAAMPHVLWELQGIQRLETTVKEHAGNVVKTSKLVLDKPGNMTTAEYDRLVRDLVNYLVYMGEPAAAQRAQTGIAVLFALSILLVLTWLLKREYWRDVH